MTCYQNINNGKSILITLRGNGEKLQKQNKGKFRRFTIQNYKCQR